MEEAQRTVGHDDRLPVISGPTISTMNRLSFALTPFEYERWRTVAVVPLVDSAGLTELIARREAERGYDSTGAYAGLVPEFFRFGELRRYFLGEGAGEDWFDAPGKIALLGCECGEVGCWPLAARVSVSADLIGWSAFEQPFRKERDYSQFGPFELGPPGYKDVLAELSIQLGMVGSGRVNGSA